MGFGSIKINVVLDEITVPIIYGVNGRKKVEDGIFSRPIKGPFQLGIGGDGQIRVYQVEDRIRIS